MQDLTPREPGAMFWAGRDPLVTLREVKGLGVRCGQLGIPGDLPLERAAAPWTAALESEQFSLVTVFCSYVGESYADIPTVQRTVGFIPEATRAEREARTLAVSDFAKEIGVSSIACHVGFIPHDPEHPDYQPVRDLVRRICDRAEQNGQTFALETGQEPAESLLSFLKDAGCQNLRINFDPANMILYGTGEPLPALEILAPYVTSVHAKDGDWPPAGQPGALGTERPLGQGQVDIPAYVAKLKEVGFNGPLNVEREVEDPQQKLADMRMAVELLKQLV